MKSLDVFYNDVEALIAGRLSEEERQKFDASFHHLHNAVSHLESSYNLSILDRAAVHSLLRKTSHDLIERYQILFEYSGTAMIVIENDGTISLVNSFFENLFGCQAKDVIFKRNFFDYITDDKRKMMMDYHLRRREGDNTVPHSYESKAMTGDGRILDVLVNIELFPGTMQSIVSIQNITERKRAEESLMQANKKLNILSSITRHDIGNEIQILWFFVDVLLEKLENTDLFETVQKINTSVENIRSQIEFTRYYQDIGVYSAQWQDIKDLILQVSTNFNDKPVEIINDIGGVEVYADPLLKKVFYNLIENAIRYGKKLTKITFYCHETDEGLIIFCEDDGVGIPEQEKRNIFLRQYFQHTGFGLFLSREILAITCLTIRETGEEGKGARFEIVVENTKFRYI